MFDDKNLKARGMSLQSLIDAMDQDESKSIPALTIRIELPNCAEMAHAEPDGDEPEQPEGVGEDAMNDGVDGGLPLGFTDLIRKKKAEKNGAY